MSDSEDKVEICVCVCVILPPERGHTLGTMAMNARIVVNCLCHPKMSMQIYSMPPVADIGENGDAVQGDNTGEVQAQPPGTQPLGTQPLGTQPLGTQPQEHDPQTNKRRIINTILTLRSTA